MVKVIKRVSLKSRASKIVSRYPVYLVFPPSKWREYALMHYKKEKDSVCGLADYLYHKGQIDFNSLATSKLAVRSAFYCGYDSFLEELLEVSINKYPQSTYFYEMKAEYDIFCGNLKTAYHYALHAYNLDSENPSIAARKINLQYAIEKAEVADHTAIDVLKKQFSSMAVLWAVCKNCQNEEQLNKILSTWDKASGGDECLFAKAVRPLANAASRVERFDVAIDLYARAILLNVEKGITPHLTSKNLGGKNSLGVIYDLKEVMDKAEIPFFLCAGTVLGIVREGKPLEHDNDIDVGIWENSWNQEKLYQAFLRDTRFKFEITHPYSSKISVSHRSGVSVDLFKFYRENDNVWHDSVLVRWKNTPFDLRKIWINNFQIQIPDPVDKYLRENYGEWRKPDPDFDAFLSENTEVLWPEYVDYHLVRQAYKKICSGNLDGAIQNLKKAQLMLQSVPEGKKVWEKLLT